MMFPGWNAKPSEFEKKFKEKVYDLAELEKDKACELVQVTGLSQRKPKCAIVSFITSVKICNE